MNEEVGILSRCDSSRLDGVCYKMYWRKQTIKLLFAVCRALSHRLLFGVPLLFLSLSGREEDFDSVTSQFQGKVWQFSTSEISASFIDLNLFLFYYPCELWRYKVIFFTQCVFLLFLKQYLYISFNFLIFWEKCFHEFSNTENLCGEIAWNCVLRW